jgi:glyoxylase-like metal-dependent hydrolase (beta-lactamase superfamily II)
VILETIVVGAFEANCYIVAAAAKSPAIIIDPGDDEPRIRRVLLEHSLEPALIVNTHGHIDHIGCDNMFGIPVYIHEKDKVLLTNAGLNLSNFLSQDYTVHAEVRVVRQNDTIGVEGVEFSVLHIPGHTVGSMALLMRLPRSNILFSGDSLFCMSIGRTDFPQSDERALVSAIKEKLLTLPDETLVYPGHGPSTTIGQEKKMNPFLR